MKQNFLINNIARAVFYLASAALLAIVVYYLYGTQRGPDSDPSGRGRLLALRSSATKGSRPLP
jgi:hypothetical protein